MKKSSKAELTRRVNLAIGILSAGGTRIDAKRALAGKFGISDRQAFRYLKIAETSYGPLAIPERKVVFTVKLPDSLIHRVRQAARISGCAIGDLVAEALEILLKMRGKVGKKRKRTPA